MAAGCPERDDAPWAGGEGTRGSNALQLKEECGDRVLQDSFPRPLQGQALGSDSCDTIS